jgi:hypothetical protein
MALITQAANIALGIRGRIDILITHTNLWAIVIETKRSSASVLEALPQTLTYMMASQDSQDPALPIYGLCTNERISYL